MGATSILVHLLVATAALVTMHTLFDSLGPQPIPVTHGNTTSSAGGSGGGGAPSSTPLTSGFNATYLQAKCNQACHGGTCQTSTLTGLVRCLSCGAPYTYVPSTSTCVDLTHCTDFHWCSTDDAVYVQSRHVALIARAVVQYPNGTVRVTYPYPYNDTTMAQFVPELAPTQHNATDLLNLFLGAKLSLLARNISTNPSAFWDDSAQPSNLAFVRAAMVPVYVPYIDTMKRRLCPDTWQPSVSSGTCVPPPSF